jgi:hypothetical protein
MSQRFTPASGSTPTLYLIVSLVLAGAMSAAAAAEELLSRPPERGGIGFDLQQLQFEGEMSGKPVRKGLLSKLDERLSLIVTDKASTSAITFSEVMGQLADNMRTDKLTLFRRWWDTAKDTKGNLFCNSATRINGFPYECPRDESEQLDPFDGANACDGYTAIAFVNRFDLADKDRAQHCGEYRIVFARNSGFGAAKSCSLPEGKRLLIIFEALVPNPEPPHSPRKPIPGKIFDNLGGCRPIVEFWLSLSDPNMSTTKRGTALHDFFLKGLPDANIGPVVDARNYTGGPASGQIRTNQLMQPNWTLREFKTYGDRIVPVTVKSNPGNSLFREDPRKIELADYLVRDDTLANLRGVASSTAGETNIDTFAFGLTEPGVDHLNSFESQAELPNEGNVVAAFDDCRLLEKCHKTDAIEKKITEELDKVGSSLSTDNIIHRIRTQTCAGCHHYSNGDKELRVDCPNGWPSRLCFIAEESGVEVRRGIWPSTLPDGGGFTQVSENEPGESGTKKEVFDLAQLEEITPDALRGIRSERISHLWYMGPDGNDSRYKISDTLKLVLMPPRFENMVLYLNDPP